MDRELRDRREREPLPETRPVEGAARSQQHGGQSELSLAARSSFVQSFLWQTLLCWAQAYDFPPLEA